MYLIKSILDCLTGSSNEDLSTTSSNPNHKIEKQNLPNNDTTEEATAKRILDTLFTFEKSNEALQTHLKTIITTTSWTERLARRILDGIVSALNSGKALVGAMKETYDKVRVIAEEFVREHPVLTEVIITVIAIGILAVLVPWAVEALGFGELGPAGGKFWLKRRF